MPEKPDGVTPLDAAQVDWGLNSACDWDLTVESG